MVIVLKVIGEDAFQMGSVQDKRTHKVESRGQVGFHHADLDDFAAVGLGAWLLG